MEQSTQHIQDPDVPCIRCGYCCTKATCDIGLTHGAEPTNCMFLIGNRPGEYSCLLVDKNVYPNIKMHLAIGDGCCSSMNSDRLIAMKNMEANNEFKRNR